ncbi:MAG: LssY C-terminal domain-containing protein, partial [Terrimicrobiaceae bacterium]
MKHKVFWLILILVVWAGVAYLLAPLVWKLYFRRHFIYAPSITRTSDGHPGDPINLAIEGSEEQLVKAMIAAGWYPADPITLASSIRIAVDSVFRKPDADAPVSALFLFGRKQDLAFELPVGDSP